ncbi:MAG TPA: hypothetical protein VM734_19345, partial [Kofleriaceae bacterium]|nr:hypothetical protein [Kofleriaceae bacterium]
MLGTSVGTYRITGSIGQGGMGVVYLAEHALLGRQAAVKVLLPELSQNQEIVTRFFNEARAATAIRHPGIGECRPARCGDGFVDMQGPVVEVCDDGNTIDTDGCRNNCTPTTTTCG